MYEKVTMLASLCRGNAIGSDGFHWPYEFPLQDSYFDVVPFMKCYYPHDILYETMPLEPTPLSFQGCKYQHHEFFESFVLVLVFDLLYLLSCCCRLRLQ